MHREMSASDALALSPAERILLVEEIWDSIANVPEAVQVTEDQQRELDSRLEACRRDPGAGVPWDVVRSRITKTA